MESASFQPLIDLLEKNFRLDNLSEADKITKAAPFMVSIEAEAYPVIEEIEKLPKDATIEDVLAKIPEDFLSDFGPALQRSPALRLFAIGSLVLFLANELGS